MLELMLWILNRVLPLALVGGVTLLLFLGSPTESKPDAPKSKRRPPAVVQVAPVIRGELAETYTATGTIVARSEVGIASQLDGIVREMRVAVGERVEKGQFLAALDDRLLKADLEQAEATLARTTQELERARQLAEKSLATQTRLQDAAAARHVAETSVNRLRTMLSLSQFPSPIDGVVVEQSVYPGDTVTTGDVLYRVADVSQLQVRIKVPEHVALKVKEGSPADLAVVAAPSDPLPATISRIYPASDPTSHQVPIELDAGAVYPRLRPGYLVTAVLTTASRQNALIVDRRAVLRLDSDRRASIFVVKSDRAEVRNTEVGLMLEDRVEVSGLQPGEEIVVRGGERLKDGDEVQVTRGAGPATQESR